MDTHVSTLDTLVSNLDNHVSSLDTHVSMENSLKIIAWTHGCQDWTPHCPSYLDFKQLHNSKMDLNFENISSGYVSSDCI